MRQRTSGKAAQDAGGERIAVRLVPPLADRFNKVVEVSKRTKTSIVEECLQDGLTKLEKQYSKAA